MAVVHISEAEAARDFRRLLEQVRAGGEVVIESAEGAIAVLRPAGSEFRPRLLSESIALAAEYSRELGYEPRMGAEFAADLEKIVRGRKPGDRSAWE